MTCAFWMRCSPIPGQVGRAAEQAEQPGFDELLLANSQNLVEDPFVSLGIPAKATIRLGLGTGIYGAMRFT
jgi:5,10-methylenetetrahydromethanopterin reductase